MISKLFTQPVYKGLTTNIKRFFDLHEYQSKDLMRKFSIKVQRGSIATNPEMAYTVAKDLNTAGDLILKAQVHAGGRGKGTFLVNSGHLTSGLKGGVQILKTPEQVRDLTKQMIGYNLITHQTPKAGLKV
jgi:succinyl-CoA synthetase beta subunit